MSGNERLTLRLTLEQLQGFCQRMMRQNTDHGHRLAALSTLQGFIAATADAGEQAREDYQRVRTFLLQQAEQERTALLQQNAARLRTALAGRDIGTIATIYQSLSRSGFWSVMEQVMTEIPAAELATLHGWCNSWVAEAKQRGEQASGCPDAIDFKAANIDIGHYVAMNDLLTFTRQTR